MENMVKNKMEDGMNKITLYPRVNVYQNAIPRHKEFMGLLKESETRNPEFLFKSWDDWYGFGKMMNLGMQEDGYNINSEDQYYIKQKDFLKTLHEIFHTITYDYINEYKISLPNWNKSGFSICKYWETNTENDLAMHYHTDYVGANADAPGLKFAVTCTMYLNDDYDGGGLSFLQEETGDVIDYKPKAGDVVVFPSGDPITGTSHYFHAVDKISNGEKYLVRTFWQYDFPGSEQWWDGIKKHGEEEWNLMAKERMKKEIQSGRWHRYLVHPGTSDKKINGSTPFYAKVEKIKGTPYLTKDNDNK